MTTHARHIEWDGDRHQVLCTSCGWTDATYSRAGAEAAYRLHLSSGRASVGRASLVRPGVTIPASTLVVSVVVSAAMWVAMIAGTAWMLS